MTYKPTTEEVRSMYGGPRYETDFDRWLDSLSPGQREQITRDIEAARDLIDRECYPEPCDCTEQVDRAAIAAAEPHIRAEAWDEAATEARDLGWIHDVAHADVVARNPYRQELP